MDKPRRRIAAPNAVFIMALAASSPSAPPAETCRNEQFTVTMGEKFFGPDDTEVASARKALARCLAKAGDYQGAAPHYQRALDTWQQQGFIRGWLADEFDEYADLLDQAGRSDDAAAARAKAAALRAGTSD